MYHVNTLSGQSDISLRPITVKDLPTLTLLANNPAIAATLRDNFPSPYTLHDAQHFLMLMQRGLLGYVWGICSGAALTGVISITPQTDIYRHSAEIGYWLGLPFQGKGIMREAVHLVTTYGFHELQLYRIFGGVFATNEASRQVLLKNGYHLEAIKQQAIIKHGNLQDEHLFVKLKNGESSRTVI
ncbi:GNAT family N-acetyltransferase [Chitinophaga nivalis]|uniref:GNAT family N-acetyltransferase n=1 Tax=Chitinophaga nivalis TaxID=2991709 RepID=A0ABT3IMP2_9BACT|nr:GNAT family N-acetyltransferase [Chitinophaga nivalis]MCW3465076.1 GNAT family N-acetyltransferase [Chitinophaga nivalis]MCW3485232.1 GNAT family N-acetyltransferase [Chitinophaga nivalis]